MPRNSVSTIATVVPVRARASYAYSPEDSLAALSQIPSGGTRLRLPSDPNGGDAYQWADVDGSCASGHPIIVAAGAGATINGASTISSSAAFASGRAVFDAESHGWTVFYGTPPSSVEPAGGLLIFPSIAALEAFDVTAPDALETGTIAYVGSDSPTVPSVHGYWSLDLESNATTDGITIVQTTPAPDGHGRWLRMLSALQATALLQPSWDVDGIAGNDENSGLTNHPVKSLAEIARRLGTRTPKFAQDVTIRILSSLPSTDPYDWTPEFVGAASLTLACDPVQIDACTIGVYTPAVFASTPSFATVTASGKPSGFWTAYVGKYVVDTTAGAFFYVIADLGTAKASITTPLSGPPSFGSSPVALTNGDTLEIFDTFTIYGDTFSYVGNGGGQVQVSTLTLTSDVVLSPDQGNFFGCKFHNTLVSARLPQPNFVGCYFESFFGTGPFQGAGKFTGGIVNGAGNLLAGGVDLDGDVIFPSRIHYRSGADALLMRRVYFGETNTLDNGSATMQVLPSAFGAARMWGPGGFDAINGLDLQCPGGAVATLLLTGALLIDGAANAFSWDAASGTYVVPVVAVTPGNIDAPGGLSNPPTGSRITGDG